MTPRLHWFSPLPPAQTDIANYAVPIIRTLAKTHEVILWYEDGADPPPAYLLPSGCFTRPYVQVAEVASTLNDGVAIYHVGNNALFHRWIRHAASVVPGIVVIHEPTLQELSAGCTMSPDQHIEWCRQYHGEAGRVAATRYWTNGLTALELGEIAPMTEWALGNPLAAVVHWRGVRDWLGDVHGLPIHEIDLAFEPSSPPPPRRTGDLQRPVNVVVAGFLGLNRQLDVTMEALAGLPERDSFVLHVAGPVLNPSLADLGRTFGIEHLVRWHGHISPVEMDGLLDRMDLAVNLRFPTMGETSGSQLRFWSRRLPTVVTATGWYGDQDPSTVAFVPPSPRDDAVKALRQHLRAFLHDPRPYRDLGDRGFARVLRRHSPALYAAALAELADQAAALRVQWARTTLADRAADSVRHWAPPDRSGLVLGRLERAIGRVLGPSNPTP